MATQSRKLLLFELNEVPYRVMDDFVARRPDSALAGVMARSKQFETVCEDQLELDPWISWPTLHRGVIDEQHGIRHLGQRSGHADRDFPPLWELVARAGRRVGVFGSLHSSNIPASLENYAFYVPDFFADDAFAHPARLRAFQEFNLLMTRRSARNVDSGIPARAAVAFLGTYAWQGMSWRTLREVLGALVAERRAPHLKSRRRSLQPLIGFDLFLPLLRRTEPDFATFYTNHVAANMHRFWAAAFPDDAAENPMPADWRAKYRGEIDYAMHVADEMLARLLKVVHDSDYLLLVASSIGQAPVPGERTTGFSTIVDLERFMTRMGLARGEWKRKPAMVPCISVTVDAAKADRFEQRLGSLAFGSHRVLSVEREGAIPFSYDRTGDDSFHMYVYFDETDLRKLPASLGGVAAPAAEFGLGHFRQEEGVACSGRHTPFGTLLVYDPRQAARSSTRTAISTLHIAPALLHNFNIPRPRYMAACDPGLLDVTSSASSVAMRPSGGGVETPVRRAAPAAAGIRSRPVRA